MLKLLLVCTNVWTAANCSFTLHWDSENYSTASSWTCFSKQVLASIQECWRHPRLGLSPYDVHSHKGFLKHLMLRTGRYWDLYKKDIHPIVHFYYYNLHLSWIVLFQACTCSISNLLLTWKKLILLRLTAEHPCVSVHVGFSLLYSIIFLNQSWLFH